MVSSVASVYLPVMPTPYHPCSRGQALVDLKNHNIKALFEEYYPRSIGPQVGKTQMSHIMRKPTMWFLNRSNTNQAIQAQKMARNFGFRK